MKSTLLVVLTALSLAACASMKNKSASTTSTKSAPAAKEAAAPETTETGKVTCTHGTETRTLEVVAKDAGCAVNYTKGGKTSTPATGSHGTKHCLDTQKKIRGKLEASGYKCS